VIYRQYRNQFLSRRTKRFAAIAECFEAYRVHSRWNKLGQTITRPGSARRYALHRSPWLIIGVQHGTGKGTIRSRNAPASRSANVPHWTALASVVGNEDILSLTTCQSSDSGDIAGANSKPDGSACQDIDPEISLLGWFFRRWVSLALYQ
jgi:hypothetical protein